MTQRSKGGPNSLTPYTESPHVADPPIPDRTFDPKRDYSSREAELMVGAFRELMAEAGISGKRPRGAGKSFSQPHQDGPRRVRRRKASGRIGVTRKPSSNRLAPAEVIRHLARSPDAIRRIRYARVVWTAIGRGPTPDEMAVYRAASTDRGTPRHLSRAAFYRVCALSGRP